MKEMILLNEERVIDKGELLEQLDRHLDWIKSCDTKSSIVLAVIGIFITIYTSEKSIEMLNKMVSESIQNINFSNLLFLLLFAISWGVFVYGGYSLIRVLVPRLSKDVVSYEGIETDSLYFFECVAKNKFSEYKDKVLNRSDNEDINDILSQIYINAKISTKKYSYYSKGIKCTFLGMAGILVLYIVGVILVKVGGF
jgi:hypothetical protein